MARIARNLSRLLSTLCVPAMALAVGLVLSPNASASNSSANTKTTSKSSAASKSTAHAMKNASHKKVSHRLASAEDLSGTISLVSPTDKEVTLIGSNGVPYDFELTRRTKVEISNQKIAIKQLASESNKQATIHFVPTSRGNMAESLRITS